MKRHSRTRTEPSVVTATRQIGEADIVAFTEGDCWALARELGALSGWQVVALGAYHEDVAQPTLDDFDWVHVAVRTPCGRLLDVRGLHRERDMIDCYEDHVWGHYGWEPEEFDFAEITSGADWEALAVQERMFPVVPVSPVATELLRRYHAGELTIPVLAA